MKGKRFAAIKKKKKEKSKQERYQKRISVGFRGMEKMLA